MSDPLEVPTRVIPSVSELQQQLYMNSPASSAEQGAILCNLGGGLLRFASAAFPGVDQDFLYAQRFDRQPEGRGPHFDVYHELVDQDHPWLALFNLAGEASLRATVLPHDLAIAYTSRYPLPTDDAFEARRDYSRLAFKEPDSVIQTGHINAGTGLFIPQLLQGPNVVHEVVPIDPENPGSFVKMVVASTGSDSCHTLDQKGYAPLDEFVTRELAARLPLLEQHDRVSEAWTLFDFDGQSSCNLD